MAHTNRQAPQIPRKNLFSMESVIGLHDLTHAVESHRNTVGSTLDCSTHTHQCSLVWWGKPTYPTF